ncbi:MAG: GTP cyclohydrolase FolE2 [Dehalococcoidia bacterium]
MTTVPGLVNEAVQQAGTSIITKHFDFEAAHYLPNVPGDHKCRRMHGHSYQVWIHVAGPMNSDAGWVVDFGDVKDVWKPLGRQLDHHLLNEIDGLENPTAENLAAWIWQRFEQMRLDKQVDFRVAAVEVAETIDSKAMFVAPKVTPWVPGHKEVALDARDFSSAVTIGPEEATGPKAVVAGVGWGARRPGEIEDVQARADGRGVAIDEVGVSGVRVPIQVMDRDHGSQSTVATIEMFVDLAADQKGTHLSCFLQVLRGQDDTLSLFTLGEMTGELRSRLGASRAHVVARFPYFLTKRAPVSGEEGSFDVDCVFEVVDVCGDLKHWLQVVTPVTTVCPCSRDISDYGAHNQRGHVDIRIQCASDEADLPMLVWIEELVDVAERAGSAPLYSVVKRPDERHVTMAGYDNPKFVEDVIRDVAVALREDDRITAFELTVENDESIHVHNAVASLSQQR